MSNTNPLDAIFRPRSVGVVGVSADPSKLGTRVWRNLVGSGFSGGKVPIGSAETIDGVTCAPNLDAVDDAPDLLFLAVPARASVDIARRAADRGVRAVIIGASGFAEHGAEGAAMQSQLAEISRSSGMRIVGPNCNGIYNAHESLSVGFNTGHACQHKPGGVAILSHSGAMFDSLARRIGVFGGGLSLFASLGNEADLDVLDYLDYALDDPNTRVAALLLDALPDGARLRTLCAKADVLGKSIVALKLGSSTVGAVAATAHSSRLAGDHAAYRALFRSCGIPIAHTLEGLICAAVMLDRFGRHPGALAALSTSGAAASLTADLCEERGIVLAKFGQATIDELDGLLPAPVLANPIDMGVVGTLKGFDKLMTAVACDPDVGAFVAMVPSFGPAAAVVANAWRQSIAASGKPHIVLTPGTIDPEEEAVLRDAGAMVLSETEPCFTGLAAILQSPARQVQAEVRAELRIDVNLPAGPLTEKASLDIMSRAGVRTVSAVPCHSRDAAIAAATRIDGPVVLKGVVSGLAHKSDSGLVALNLIGADAVGAAWDRMGMSEVLVQPMLRGELEAIVGYSRNVDTGPMLLLGLGGIHTETLKQTSLVALPASREQIAEMIDGSIVGRVISGPRWQHEGTRDEVIDLLCAVQDLALANPDRLAAADINPVLLGSHGATAVDALVVIEGN